MTDHSSRIDQACLDIFLFQPGITFKNGFRRISSSKHSEDIFNRNATSPDDRLPAEDLRVYSDPNTTLVQRYTTLTICFSKELVPLP